MPILYDLLAAAATVSRAQGPVQPATFWSSPAFLGLVGVFASFASALILKLLDIAVSGRRDRADEGGKFRSDLIIDNKDLRGDNDKLRDDINDLVRKLAMVEAKNEILAERLLRYERINPAQVEAQAARKAEGIVS